MTETEQPEPAIPHSCPLVSVVIPTKDSIRTIERCLRSIREQTWPAVELVVIDNYSEDGTWEVAQEAGGHCRAGRAERAPNVTWVSNARQAIG